MSNNNQLTRIPSSSRKMSKRTSESTGQDASQNISPRSSRPGSPRTASSPRCVSPVRRNSNTPKPTRPSIGDALSPRKIALDTSAQLINLSLKPQHLFNRNVSNSSLDNIENNYHDYLFENEIKYIEEAYSILNKSSYKNSYDYDTFLIQISRKFQSKFIDFLNDVNFKEELAEKTMNSAIYIFKKILKKEETDNILNGLLVTLYNPISNDIALWEQKTRALLIIGKLAESGCIDYNNLQLAMLFQDKFINFLNDSNLASKDVKKVINDTIITIKEVIKKKPINTPSALIDGLLSTFYDTFVSENSVWDKKVCGLLIVAELANQQSINSNNPIIIKIVKEIESKLNFIPEDTITPVIQILGTFGKARLMNAISPIIIENILNKVQLWLEHKDPSIIENALWAFEKFAKANLFQKIDPDKIKSFLITIVNNLDHSNEEVCRYALSAITNFAKAGLLKEIESNIITNIITNIDQLENISDEKIENAIDSINTFAQLGLIPTAVKSILIRAKKLVNHEKMEVFTFAMITIALLSEASLLEVKDKVISGILEVADKRLYSEDEADVLLQTLNALSTEPIVEDSLLKKQRREINNAMQTITTQHYNKSNSTEIKQEILENFTNKALDLMATSDHKVIQFVTLTLALACEASLLNNQLSKELISQYKATLLEMLLPKRQTK